MSGEELTNEELVALLRHRLPDILREGFPDIPLEELIAQRRSRPSDNIMEFLDNAFKELIGLVSEFVASKAGWQGLYLAACRDEKLAWAVCHVAGHLSRNDESLKAQTEETMKPGPRWHEGHLIAALTTYGIGLRTGDPKFALRLVRVLEERESGKPVSDKRIQNILSEALKKIPLELLPDDIRPGLEKRLDRGRKTRHRGW